MRRQQHKQKRLAQNFLKEAGVVRRLVRISKIDAADTVYEIGPGGGIITAELARRARRVIAIEKDPALVRFLRRRFRATPNTEIIQADFLDYSITTSDYKIFANIPFNLTASIVRKILWTRPAPAEAYLIMQREPARKFAGLGGETLFSVLAKPYFDVRLAARLRRTDFHPVPKVGSVMLQISRRSHALISKSDAHAYRDFVSIGFNGWKPDLRTSYKRVFSYTQWKRLSRYIGFPIDATPSQLTFDQWLSLYRMFRALCG
jgi:23S rRNA (adenine-N6)-dimethyltransferase